MARTTAAQFARQLRRLGATVAIRDDFDIVASYGGVEVTAQFSRDPDAFAVARRTDTAAEQTEPIRTMAGVRRVLNLPKQPVAVLGATGRRNSLNHILRPGWAGTAECGVYLPGPARRTPDPGRYLPTLPVPVAAAVTAHPITAARAHPAPAPMQLMSVRRGRTSTWRRRIPTVAASRRLETAHAIT